MKLTATEEVAVRCLVQLARQGGNSLALSQLAAAEGLPEPFAAKVMAHLRRAGLVEAVRGRRGGYRLAAPPNAITVARVLTATGSLVWDPDACSYRGPHGRDACPRRADCSLRPVWSQLDAIVHDLLSRTTLADLTAGEGATRNHLATHWPLPSAAGRTGDGHNVQEVSHA